MQLPQPTTFSLIGKNRQSRKREEHTFEFMPGGKKCHHRWMIRGENEVKQERIGIQVAWEKIGDLTLLGLKWKPVPQQRGLLDRIFFQLETIFRTHSSFIYFSGLGAFTTYYILAVGLSQWYEWASFVAALLLGTFISRATKMSLLGLFSVEIEQYSAKALYEQQTRQAEQREQQVWWQGYTAGVQSQQQPQQQSD